MQRSFTARVGNDVRIVQDKPFVIAYERPLGVNPEECDVVNHDVFGDASPAEMIDLAVSIGIVLAQMGLWDRVVEQIKDHRSGRRLFVATPVEPAVQRSAFAAPIITDNVDQQSA